MPWPVCRGRIISSSVKGTGGSTRSEPSRGASPPGSTTSAWRPSTGVRCAPGATSRTTTRPPTTPAPRRQRIHGIDWDDFAVVPDVAHALGMRAELYVSVLDDGRGLPSDEERAVSFHNDMHGQHVTWQTDWSREHPEYAVVDRRGTVRQWGVLCYAYEEVRRHMADRIEIPRRRHRLRRGLPLPAEPGPAGRPRRPVRLQRPGPRRPAGLDREGHPERGLRPRGLADGRTAPTSPRSCANCAVASPPVARPLPSGSPAVTSSGRPWATGNCSGGTGSPRTWWTSW